MEEREFFHSKALLTNLDCQNTFSSAQRVRMRLQPGYIKGRSFVGETFVRKFWPRSRKSWTDRNVGQLTEIEGGRKS